MLRYYQITKANPKTLNDNHPMTKPIAKHQPQIERIKRSFGFKFIQWVILLWMVLGVLRFIRTLSGAWIITNLVTPVLYAYLLASGLISGLLGLAMLWALAQNKPWSLLGLKVSTFFYPALYWFERLFLWQDPNAHHNWPFMLLLTIAWFGLMLWGLKTLQTREVI